MSSRLNLAHEDRVGLQNLKRVQSSEERLTLTSTIEMFTLTVRQKDNESATVHCDEMKITIGRSSRNGICVSDRFASRFHAEIKQEGDQVLLIDAASANGTFLNGLRVTAPTPLRPGDRIQIGQTEIEYSAGEQDIVSLS